MAAAYYGAASLGTILATGGCAAAAPACAAAGLVMAGGLMGGSDAIRNIYNGTYQNFFAETAKGFGAPSWLAFGLGLGAELPGAGPRATTKLLDAMRRHGRTISIAKKGSEELRYLNVMGAEANVGGPKLLDILLRENPSKVAALEEFLHGTQSRLGIIDRLGVQGAESHMESFLERHRKLLGLE
jgi:hypothetical protein